MILKLNNYKYSTFLFLVLALTFSGCSKDEEPSIIITVAGPTDVIIGLNNDLQLVASINGVVSTEQLSWTSSNSIMATVSPEGLVTARRHGVVTITASNGSVSGEYDLQLFNVSGEGLPGFDEVMVDFMRQFTVPGASYAVVKDGKLVMVRGYGLADVETQEVVTPASLFRIADISKPITATAIMKLVDDGLLDLDEKMFTILVDKFPIVNLPDVRITDITVRQLLNHTSGTNLTPQPMFNQGLIAFDKQVESPPTLDVILDWFADRTLGASPGERFFYHNMNYVLLGRVIEAKSGMTYEEYVKTNILDPIEVTEARIGLSHQAEKFPKEVSYYSPFTSDVKSVFDTDVDPVSLPYGGIGDIQNMDAHGGWIASVVDLARFALATDGNPAQEDIITSGSQEYMVEVGSEGNGSGWFVEDDNWNHAGLMPGTMSSIIVKGNGLIIIGLLNSTQDFNGPINQLMFNAFINDITELAATTVWEDQDLFDEY
jgi:D-alanyl-D-alanine carboxypeptidase